VADCSPDAPQVDAGRTLPPWTLRDNLRMTIRHDTQRLLLLTDASEKADAKLAPDWVPTS
jgi:hypothetical protein